MRRLYFVSIGSLLILVACNNTKNLNNANFTKAINAYLTKHGEACAVIGRPFPIDVSESEQRLQSGTAQEMATLEQAGLLQSSRTIAVVHGMMGALRNSTPPQPVKRYELTTEGKKYFQQVPALSGRRTVCAMGRRPWMRSSNGRSR